MTHALDDLPASLKERGGSFHFSISVSLTALDTRKWGCIVFCLTMRLLFFFLDCVTWKKRLKNY